MSFEIKVPRLGWSMEEGTFLGWLKKDGDAVAVGEPLFTFEGDKSAQEVESTDAGILRIAADAPTEGQVVAVGTVLGHLFPPSPPGSAGGEGSGVRGAEARRVSVDSPLAGDSPPSPPAPPAARLRPQSRGERGERHEPDRLLVTPRARRVAAERGVDVRGLTGTGANGRIRERDVPTKVAPRPRADTVRRVIAERMMHSARNTAPVTLTTTADATNLVALRKQFKAVPGAVVPTLTDLIVKLTALALRSHPAINASWDDGGVVTHDRIDVGVAVDAEVGLVVPVVRSADTLGVRALAEASKSLVEKARAGRLTAAEMDGGTFTVTNLGSFGVEAFTPIIHFPQAAILGVGRIREEAAVVEGRIVPRERVTLSLTFDHRVVDGAPAARFLQAVAGAVENPGAWLIG